MSRVWVFAAAAAATIWAAPAVAETVNCTNITTLPATISSQGVYCLKQDLSTSMTSGAAITINANNVTIDFNGYRLGGLAAGPATQAFGVYALSRSNITLRNGNIRGFKTGIYLNGAKGGPASGHLVENNLVDGNTGTGIFASGAGVTVRGNRVVNTGPGTGAQTTFGIYGIFLANSLIEGNLVGDTISGKDSIGIDLYDSSDVDVSRNSISVTSAPNASAYGIHMNISNRINVIDNSIIGTTSLAYATGIRSKDSSLLLVRNNNINGVNGDVDHGVVFETSSLVVCRDNTIIEPTFIPLGCTTQSGTVELND